MMGLIQSGIAYLGRVLLGVVFLFSAMIETLDWGATEQYYTMVFTRWMQVYQGDESAGWFMAHILPCLPTILIVGVIFRLLGSLLLIVNWQVRFASLLLLIFLFAETYVLYDFWHVQGPEQTTAMLMFFKNSAVFGGLLLILSLGKGVQKRPESS